MDTLPQPRVPGLFDANGKWLADPDLIHTAWFALDHHYCQTYDGRVFRQHKNHFHTNRYWEQTN